MIFYVFLIWANFELKQFINNLIIDNETGYASLNDTVSLIQQTHMNYCLCDVNLSNHMLDSSIMYDAQIHNSIGYTSCCLPLLTCSPNNPTYDQEKFRTSSILSKYKMTKRNAQYLAELEGFSYDVQERIDSISGKLIPIYICKYGNTCNKEFQRSWNLLDHVRMHYNIRPFVCTYCGFRFTQKGNLNKHMLKHLIPNVKDRKKFKCDQCGKSYTKRSNYTVSLFISKQL